MESMRLHHPIALALLLVMAPFAAQAGPKPSAQPIQPSRVELVGLSPAAGEPGSLDEPARIATLDAFLRVDLKPRASAKETVTLVVDGAVVGRQSMTLQAGAAAAYEIMALEASFEVGAEPAPHQVKVILEGTYAASKSWILEF